MDRGTFVLKVHISYALISILSLEYRAVLVWKKIG